MRAAIYARVSTANGDQHPENQVHDVTAWACRLGHDVVNVYVDRQTGSTDNRPALQEALRAAHPSHVGALQEFRPSGRNA